MNKKIIIVFWIIVIAIVFILKINKVVSPSENLPTAEINGYVFNIDIADDLEEMKQGLSGREALAENQGMLFIYKKKIPVSFWMKDMKFNIDLLWIDGDKVVGFAENMQAPIPETSDYDLPQYSSGQAIDKVLEIKEGKIDELNIKVGDIINLNI